MKTMKKVAAVVFALLLVLSTVSLGVSAEGDEDIGEIGITITADKTTNLYPGDIVTFTINISTKYKSTAMHWPVMYTTKAFEPVINGTGDTSYGNVIGYGPLDATGSYLESGELPASSEAFGGTYSKTNYSGIQIQWTAGTNGNGLNYYYQPSESGFDCLTFQLRVKSGYTANRGVGTVAIPTTTQARNFFYYQGITNPSDPNTLYKWTSETCTVTANVCKVNIIKELAGIIPKAGSDTVIDTSHDINYIYGLTELITSSIDLDQSTLSRFVTLTGDASCVLTTNEAENYSTGSVLYVYDADGNEIDQYTIIVFGDVDGDGEIVPYDMALIITAISNGPEWSWDGLYDNATFLACDVNGDGNVFPEDCNILQRYQAGYGYPDQTHSGAGLITN